MDQRNKEFIRLLAGSGWRQARAAKELGITSGTISRYVSGEIRPKIPILRLFADRLGERLDLDDDPEFESQRPTHPRNLQEWEREALALFGRLPYESRLRIIRGLREVVEAIRVGSSLHADSANPAGIETLLEKAGPFRIRTPRSSADTYPVHPPTSEASSQPERDPSRSNDQPSVPGRRRRTTEGSSSGEDNLHHGHP